MSSIQSHIRRLALSAVLMGGLIVPAQATVSMQNQKETLKFTVLRSGSPVGTHVIDIQGTPDGATVKIKTDVVVTLAFIPVYRFEQTSEEVWREGRLETLSSTTNDDGDAHELAVHRDADKLVVVGDTIRHTLPQNLLPASLWNPALVKEGKLLNTINGKTMAVSVVDVGEDSVDVHGKPRPAHHYALTGDLTRELRYDRDGNLVRVSFAAKDDSRIDYILE
ncbi:hypothetical protein JCM17960_16490 [Magnetospira thiophila]